MIGVTGFELRSRTPIAGGKAFGEFGPYEELSGIVSFAIDPRADTNSRIVDLNLARTDPEGLVRFQSDLILTAPVTPFAHSGRLLIDIPNRGRPSATRWLNSSEGFPTPSISDAGNGFLMRNGFVVARCGWQSDVPDEPGRVHLHGPPMLQEAEEVSGLVLHQFQSEKPTASLLLSHRDHQAYPTNDVDDPNASLTVRLHDGAPRIPIPRHQWKFARSDNGRVVSDARHIWLKGGFRPGLIYELCSTTQGSHVTGLGLLAIRDVTAWLLYGDTSTGNPFPNQLQYALGHGESQTGRFLREFLYQGLNQDSGGRTVFSGVLIVVAGARRGEFNMRFGQASKTLAEDFGALYPFHDTPLTDPATGKKEGLLDRQRATGGIPKIITMNSSTEYWGGDRGAGGQASLLHTDPASGEDVEPPDESRVYLISGAQHVPQKWPTGDVTHLGVACQQTICSLDHQPFSRALLLALDRWVSTGYHPPPSRIPRSHDGTASTAQAAIEHLAAIPGFGMPVHLPELFSLDFGIDPGLPTHLPPVLGAVYGHFVSSLDDDGNEIAGIRHPDVEAPLATYTGINLRHHDAGAPGTLEPAEGAMYPFATTEAARRATGDSRRSIEERYRDEADYLDRIREACQSLVLEGFLLSEDVERITAEAATKYRALIQDPQDPDPESEPPM